MVMDLQGGFLQMTEEDKLIDKFIDEKGNISEDDLAKLARKEEGEQDEPKQDREDADVRDEPREEPDRDQAEDGPDLADDGEGESDEPDPKPVQEEDKKSKVESNQSKAIRIEREKRKELEKALKLQAERSQKIEEVLNTVLQPKEGPKEVIPDPDEDPVGHQNYKIEKLERLQQQHQDYLRQQHEYQVQLQQEQQFMGMYTQDARKFTESQPDFMDAYRHVVNSRIEEHLIAGYDQKVAEELFKQEEAAWVAKAFQDGESPSSRIYALAKKRGYAQEQKKSVASPPQQSKLSTLKQGIKSNKSLGPNSGGRKDWMRVDPGDPNKTSDRRWSRTA